MSGEVYSRLDGSPAFIVCRDPFTLRNENGDEWTDDPDDWAESPNVATIEERNGVWVVLYAGAVVGRHTAKFRARKQADDLNA